MSQVPNGSPGAEPAVVSAWRCWRTHVAALLPAVLVGYLGNAVVLGLEAAQRIGGGAGLGASAGATAVGLGVSWLGQVWAGAVTLLAVAGCEVTARSAWRVVRRGGLMVWLGGLVRGVVVYAPWVLLGVIAASAPATRQVGQPTFLPVAFLVLAPLSICLAALLGLAPLVVVAERPATLAAFLYRAWRLGDQVFVGLLVGAGAVFGIALLASFLPLHRPVYFPNHAVGSYLWVLLATLYIRARRAVEPQWAPADLAATLGEPLAADPPA